MSSLAGRLLALNLGRVGVLRFGGKDVQSAFRKHPVEGPVHLGPLGFDGDEQAWEHHGGPDRAVLVYSRSNYRFWREQHGLDLPDSGAFGENFTVDGLTERDVHLGDVFEIGEAVVQVTQARPPCFKIGARYGVPRMAVLVQEAGCTGYLLRVLRPGLVEAGQEMVLVSRHAHGMTVAEANRIMNVDRQDLDGARMLLELPDLAAVTVRDLRVRLERHGLGEDVERLYGV